MLFRSLPAEDKTWALNKSGFKRVADDMPVDITALPDDDTSLYYTEEPYTLKKLHQRLIITYSPKYAHYQKTIREKQVERAEKMISSGNKKNSVKIQTIRGDLLVRPLSRKMEKRLKSIPFLTRIKSQAKQCTMACMLYARTCWMMM